MITTYQQIFNYLTPLLGETTAANLIRHYCVKMKISVDEIAPHHLPDLAGVMRPMLAVWLGTSGAARAAERIAKLGGGDNIV